jgi:CO dehydrogenase/acetyl-CoA synthase alpha subunit
MTGITENDATPRGEVNDIDNMSSATGTATATASLDLWDVDALIAELEVTYQATHKLLPDPSAVSNVITKCSTCEMECPSEMDVCETGACDTGSVWSAC